MGVIQSAGALAPRDRVKTTPTLRAAAGATVNAGSGSITVTVPASAQVGDLAVFVIAGASATCSTPAGLTKEFVSDIGDSNNQPYLHVYTRRFVAGDVSPDQGVAFTFTFGDTDGVCGGVQVFANTAGFGVRPTSTFHSQADTLAAHTIVPPSIHTGPSDLYAGASAVLAYISSGTANATLTSPPAGCSTSYNVTALRSGGAGATCRGLAAWTGPSHPARDETLAYPAQEWCSSLVFSLAPLPPHTIDTDIAPTSLAGTPVYNYSCSSGSCVVQDQNDVTRGCVTYRPWPERVQEAFGVLDRHRNMAMGGARGADICTAAYGTFVYTSVRAGAGNANGQTNQFLPKAVTQTALANRLTALYTTQVNGNDFLMLGSPTGAPAQTLAGSRHSTNALWRLIRAETVHGRGQGGQTADGTFADVSSDGYLNGVASRTTTPGGKITIPVTDKPNVDIVLIAHDSTAQSIVGAPYVIKVDDIVVPNTGPGTLNPGTTHNQMKATGVYKDYKFCQIVVSLTGLAPGSHTITVEHAGNAGDVLIYNGHMFPAANPPWILAQCVWNMPDATLTGWAGYQDAATGQAARAAHNQITRDIAASYGDGRVIVYDSDTSGRWVNADHVAADGIHPSELGTALWAHEMIRMLNERIPTPYLAPTNPAPLSPTTVPAEFTMVGTRDFTVTAGNNTFAIECEGAGGGGGGGATGLQGRGGGGGAYAKKNTFTFTTGSVLRVTVGVGGAGGPQNTAGSAGSATQVLYLSGPDFAANTVLCKADFGTGGDFGKAVPGPVGQGGLAANCVGEVKTSGSNGSGINGGAAAAPLGGAGGVWSSGNGTPGTPPGGGGSGGGGGPTTGGAGARGVVKFS